MKYSKFLAASAKRREAIKALRARQWTWTDIARRYEITPQRAQQIGKSK